jgi:hypothetical protein
MRQKTKFGCFQNPMSFRAGGGVFPGAPNLPLSHPRIWTWVPMPNANALRTDADTASVKAIERAPVKKSLPCIVRTLTNNARSRWCL